MRERILVFTVGLIVLTPNDLYGQPDMVDGYKPRNLTRGKMWSTYRNNGLDGGGNRNQSGSHSQESLTYPGGASRVGEDFVEYWLDVEAYIKGEPNLIDIPRVTLAQNSKGQGVWILAITDGGDTLVSYAGPRNVTEDVKDSRYAIGGSPEVNLGDATGPNLTRSNYSPTHNTIAREPVEIHNYRYGDYIPNDEFPEEIIISQWETKTGITTTKKAYAWSYPEYDDFIIEEVIFENRGSKNLDPIYFALMNSFSINAGAHGWAEGGGMGWSDWRVNRLQTQDDLSFYTGASNYEADNPDLTDSFRAETMIYQRDDDWVGTNWNDTGQPYRLEVANTGANEFQGQEEGQLLAFQYVGMGILDFHPPFAKDSDAYVEPVDSDQPFAVKWWHSGNIDEQDYSEPTSTRHTDSEMFLMMTDTTDGRIMDNPDYPDLTTHSMVFGPYSLQAGEKAKLVFAFVGGSGADWHGEDEFTWSKTDSARLQLREGERSLFSNYARAKFAYKNGFDVPDPPPDVEIRFGNSHLGQVIVRWSDAADDAIDPDYTSEEATDVRGYRIYRSWPPSHYWHWGPWVLAGEIELKDPNYYDPQTGTYSFTDMASFAGYNYYYSVRSFDSGHDHWYDMNGEDHGPIPSLESGLAAPEQHNMIAVSPFQPSSDEFNAMSKPIRVVPNPYRLDFSDNQHRYPDNADPFKIRFINLPNHCTIRIYSASGDLVYEKEHLNQKSGEDAWRQDTISFSGLIVSGIYFWVVESLEETSMGQIQRGTLAVVK